MIKKCLNFNCIKVQLLRLECLLKQKRSYKRIRFQDSNQKGDQKDQKEDITQKYQKQEKELEQNYQRLIANNKEELSNTMEDKDRRNKILDLSLVNLKKQNQVNHIKFKKKLKKIFYCIKKNYEVKSR
ncbi:unnamed protein product [Paramecium sonneborni]|uniref:Uncharacterized protein n=1 Tax=Paramecium sonneborni TaxID=65129 RepID=A0A8S1RR05_9CILI|nr:unnamed protein product [Paramecium sonneborni]